MENPEKPGGLESAFVMQRCLHCLEPACVSACPTTALYRQADGPVSYEVDKCIGCRYCVLACPWDVPTSEWNTRTPKISKCTHCADRAEQPVPIAFNGKPLADGAGKRFIGEHRRPPPASRPAPPTPCATEPGRRCWRSRTSGSPTGPTSTSTTSTERRSWAGRACVYLSAVPFEKLGFPTFGEKPFPAFTKAALGAVPPAVMAVGALLGAAYAFFRKRVQAVADGSAAAKHSADHGHVEFEPLPNKLLTPFNWVLLLLMAFGGVSLVARFALGLGGSTNLSDTYPWGLWILFDLVWIAVAAGAFAMAGVIYVFQRKDLYPLGRTAVLMGLLSYSFVMVTLLADLGLPLHSYQLALNAPHHSAMFEVSWCVGLYVTILLLEFLPVPLGRLGIPAGRGRVAAMERRLRGGGGDAVHLSACRATSSTPWRRPWSSAPSPGSSGRGTRRRSRSCSRSPPSRCRPCTRARSAPCTC